jgi:transcriptional regulator with XRE-family HTH domain
MSAHTKQPRKSPPPPDTLGGRLRAARKAKRLLQGEVGSMFGVSGQTVSTWEANESRPTDDRLTKLAEIYEVGFSDLTGLNLNQRADLAEAQNEAAGLMETPRRNHRNHRNLIHVGEIHESDFLPTTKNLLDIPEFYSWRLPEHLFPYVRDPTLIRVMRISSDANAPTFEAGDYLLIDCGVHAVIHTRAFYVCNDAQTATWIRRIEPVRDVATNKDVYRLSADGGKVTVREIRPEDLFLLGRVIGTLRMVF